MSFNITDKVALVTGANRGIGKSIVESFLAHGAKKVYLAVRDLDSTTELVERYADKVSPLLIDMSKPESIVTAAKQATDVQVVVNNAGILKVAAPLDEHAEQSLTEELNINAFGLLRIAQAFTPVLEKNGPGALVQLNSVASIKNFAALTTYSASKAAAYSITQGLKESLAPKGITVLSVHPGPINTDMAAQGGMTDIAEPTSVVAEGIVTSLKAGDFHLFPDAMARDFQGAYQSYADNIIEADLSEG